MKRTLTSLLALFLLLLATTGCDVGMQRVNEPRLLLAPNDRAVLIIIQKPGGYLSAPLLDYRGGCVGYTRDDSWFAARMYAGEQVLHLKDAERLLSVKLDLEAGKTYFLVAGRKSNNDLDLTPIRTGDREWKNLDRLLASIPQYAFDRNQCDATMSEMTWMPGQDLPKLLADGKRKADAVRPLLKQDDGVAWRGSAAKSAR